MAASEKETDFRDCPTPAPMIIPVPFNGPSVPFQPMAGMNQNALAQFGQPQLIPQPQIRMLITSQDHYKTLVQDGSIYPSFPGPPAKTYLWELARPEPLALPIDREPSCDRDDPEQRPIYYDCVTKISTYTKPTLHGEGAWAGTYGPPQVPLQPALGQYGQAPQVARHSLAPYWPAQHLAPPVPGTLVNPKSHTIEASSSSLQQPNQPIPGSWTNPKTIASQASRGNVISPNPVQSAQDKPSGGVQFNGAKKKNKVVFLLEDGITKGVLATDSSGKQELRAIRPPANRAASHCLGFASNQHAKKSPGRNERSASTYRAVTNPHEETSDVDRTPHPSDFMGKKANNGFVNVPVPVSAPVLSGAQAYRPGLQAEVQRRLRHLEKDVAKSAKELLPKEVRQLVVETLKSTILGDMQDPYKQGKEERQRNVDLLQMLEFSEADKFIGEYISLGMSIAGLNKRMAREQGVLRAKQGTHGKNNRLQLAAAAYGNGKTNQALKNLKHALPSDLYHLKHAPQTPPRQLAASNEDESPWAFYTQEKQFMRTPIRGKVGGTQKAQYEQPTITSPTQSECSFDDVEQTIIPYDCYAIAKKFATAAAQDDVFTASPPSNSYSGATAYSERELIDDEAVDLMLKNQLVLDLAETSKSYIRPINAVSGYSGPGHAVSNFIRAIRGDPDANAFNKAQPFTWGTGPSAMPSELLVGYANQRRSSALNVENARKSSDVMLNVLQQPELRRQQSLLFVKSSIADALSAAESIRSEQGVWKPVDQQPLAISDRAHYPSHTDNAKTQVRYKYPNGALGRTASHKNGFAQAQVVSKGNKASEDSRGQQTSAPNPDENNFYKNPGGLDKCSFINVATGKEVTRLPPLGGIIPVPKCFPEDEKPTISADENSYYIDPSGLSKSSYIHATTGKQVSGLPPSGVIVPLQKVVLEEDAKPGNTAVDVFIQRYTKATSKEAKDEKEAAAKAVNDRAKNSARPNQRLATRNIIEQDMSFLTIGGQLPGGWKAVSDSGHNSFTSRNLAAPQVPSTERADQPRHNPVMGKTGHSVIVGVSRPGQQHFGQWSGFSGHHYPQHGTGMIYHNPYNHAVPWNQHTSYDRFSTHQQQYNYQQQFTGTYGNGMAGRQRYDNGHLAYDGYMTVTSTNKMGGRGDGRGSAPEGGQGQTIVPGQHNGGCGVGPNYRNFTHTGPYGRR